MLWGANRNFTKAIVKAFPAYRKSGRSGTGLTGKERRHPRVKRSSTALERIRAKDSDRRRLLRSPLRWFLVLTLGYLAIDSIANTPGGGGIGMSSIFLVAVLWGSAFSRTLTFRVMCSAILLTSTAAFGLFGVNTFQVVAMAGLSMVLTMLALKALPKDREERVATDDA